MLTTLRPTKTFLERPTDMLLLASSMALFLLAIIFQDAGVLPPPSSGDALFVILIAFLLALYRPTWAFFLLVASLPLEIIDVAPGGLGVHLRPYQLLALCLIAAIVVRASTGRVRASWPRLHWTDGLIALIAIGGWLGVFAAPDPRASLKQSMVILSFVLVYAVSRYFLRTVRDVSRIVPFVVGSAIVTLGYALWQNIRFALGRSHFEVMLGRPNAGFTEADWLGMFLLVIMSISFVQIWRFIYDRSRSSFWESYLAVVGNWFFLVLILISLLVTVARSAWLGALLITIVFSVIIGIACLKKHISYQELFLKKGFVGSAVIMAILLVIGLHHTNFPLYQRVQSTSGTQVITISCLGSDEMLPKTIQNTDELAQYGCRHINLEEISAEQAVGHLVTTIDRPDPNVSVRAAIYSKVLDVLRVHPILGIGWGSIGDVLGRDERGAALNASNVFLEVWLGSGLMGLLAFVALWFWIAGAAWRLFLESTDPAERALALFLVLSWTGLTVFDSFNSGLLLGFVWVWLAIGVIVMRKR